MGKPAPAYDPRDIQQQQLAALVKERRAEIEAAEEPMVALTFAMYEIVAEYLRQVINTDVVPGKLAVIGGIQVRMRALCQN